MKNEKVWLETKSISFHLHESKEIWFIVYLQVVVSGILANYKISILINLRSLPQKVIGQDEDVFASCGFIFGEH